jgi:hypothetical protein
MHTTQQTAVDVVRGGRHLKFRAIQLMINSTVQQHFSTHSVQGNKPSLATYAATSLPRNSWWKAASAHLCLNEVAANH